MRVWTLWCRRTKMGVTGAFCAFVVWGTSYRTRRPLYTGRYELYCDDSGLEDHTQRGKTKVQAKGDGDIGL